MSHNNPMKFRITQNLSDFEKYKLTILILLRSPRIRLFLGFSVLVLLLYIVFIILEAQGISYYGNSEHNYTPTLIFFSLPSIIIFVLPLISIKLKKSDPPVYEFDEWRLTLITKNRELNISWGDFVYYLDLRDYILIYHGLGQTLAHIIPKREFKTREELNAFEQLLAGTGLKKK